ncbi:MAG: hypothetical protein INQ03_11760 [Candidatus Heimdallarchaeota archaeon]|nr:hypothetical protein [Candidatus Heimdallarchaeota archaeon]
MTESEETTRRNNINQILQSASFGVLSTISADVVHGYPLGSVIPFLTNANMEIILLASNLAEYRRNFAINEKVCFTVLNHIQNSSIQGINYFGKVKAFKGELGFIKQKFIEKFPISKHLVNAEGNNFYIIQPQKIRFFDNNTSYWVNFDIL